MNAIPDNFLVDEYYIPKERCKFCLQLIDGCICEEIFEDDL